MTIVVVRVDNVQLPPGAPSSPSITDFVAGWDAASLDPDGRFKSDDKVLIFRGGTYLVSAQVTATGATRIAAQLGASEGIGGALAFSRYLTSNIAPADQVVGPVGVKNGGTPMVRLYNYDTVLRPVSITMYVQEVIGLERVSAY